MIDRRESILARLVVLMGTVKGIERVYRNNPNPNEGQMPAVVIFDADEEVAPVPETHHYKGATAPQIVIMRPEIFICLSERASDAGTRLNELRAAIYKAIVSDATLVSLVGTNGRINFHAVRTGFAVGRSLAAELKLEIAFTYVLAVSDL